MVSADLDFSDADHLDVDWAAGHYSCSIEDKVVQSLGGVGREGAPDEVSIFVDCKELCQPRDFG